MNTNNRLVFHWSLIAGCLGMIVVITACAGFAAVGSNSDELLRLNDGIVEVQDDSGDWVPVGGESTFELVGELEGTDPWKVAGVTLETRESTQIEEGLQIGDVVRVRGVILEDETWVAYSIELAEEQTDPIIVLIGIVDSVDPWVVNGITLNVTDETEIQGTITPGMIVRVEILLLPDGTWEVLSISPMGDFTETPGCATVIATVLSVNGNEIQFLGWPTTVTLEEDTQIENDGETVSANQVVLAVVCVSDNGQIVIIQIIVLNANNDNNDGDTSVDEEKVLVCHKPDKNGGHTLSISSSAVPAHLAHGDTLGACP
jgi:hypothetical protein